MHMNYAGMRLVECITDLFKQRMVVISCSLCPRAILINFGETFGLAGYFARYQYFSDASSFHAKQLHITVSVGFYAIYEARAHVSLIFYFSLSVCNFNYDVLISIEFYFNYSN